MPLITAVATHKKWRGIKDGKVFINDFHPSCALHGELGDSLAFHACDLMSKEYHKHED